MDVTVPKTDVGRVAELRLQYLNRLQDEIESISPQLKTDVEKAIAQISKRKWKQAAIKDEIKKLYQRYKGRVEKQLIALVDDSVKYGERYAQLLQQATKHNVIAGSDVVWATTMGAGATRAVFAYIKRKSAEGKKSFRGRIDLSKSLHKHTVQEQREVTRIVTRAIREGKNIGQASAEMIEAAKGTARAYARLPRAVERYVAAARKTANLLDVDMDKEIRRLEKYMRGLRPDGRVKSAYRELIQDINKLDPTNLDPRLDNAIANWVHHKQRYAAERILNTESQTAWRLATIERTESHPWLIGYQWQMNRGVHGQYAKRTKKPKAKRKKGPLKGTRRRCICEYMDGKLLTKEEAVEWQGGGHPNCACVLNPVYRRA